MTVGDIDLLPNEYVLWSGEPKRFPLFLPADAFMVPFSLLWCGFVISWEFLALRSDEVGGNGVFGGISC